MYVICAMIFKEVFRKMLLLFIYFYGILISIRGENMQHKLIIDDIKDIENIEILGEGKQAKNIIEAKYGSIKAFHKEEKLEISLKALMNYCSLDKIPSTSFKCKLVNIFNLDYDDIIVPKHNQVRHQIKKYVNEIFNNIVMYGDISDLDTFDKIINMCDRLDLIYEKFLMFRNIAKIIIIEMIIKRQFLFTLMKYYLLIIVILILWLYYIRS